MPHARLSRDRWQMGRGKRQWTASRTRTLARLLRRQRLAEQGPTRGAAVAARCNAFRHALGAHWSLCDTIGCHLPGMAQAIEAARLLRMPEATEAIEAMARLPQGN